MFRFLILICTTILPLSHCFQIHDYLTDEEILKVFKVTRDYVPEYDVVELEHSFHAYDSKPVVQLKAFDQDFKFYLDKNDLLIGKDTPVYLGYKDNSKRSGVRYEKVDHRLDFETFHDMNRRAAIMIQRHENQPMEIHGTIGDDIVIRPIPVEVKNKIGLDASSRKRRSADNAEFLTTHHIVMKVPLDKKSGSFEVDHIYEALEKSNARSKRDLPNEIYPEILVTSDYETFVAHGKDYSAVIKYMIVFWNGVDLRFRSVKNPAIHLNIAGIIIPQEYGVSPFLENKYNGNQVVDSQIIDNMSKFFYVENFFPRNSYDMVIALTKLDIVSVTRNGISRQTAGLAYFARACAVTHYWKTYDSVALVEDNIMFSGVLATAHEIAHLLGASHDGDASSRSDIPGAKTCPFDDGFLMSYRRYNENGVLWSECTLNSFRAFLSHPQASCLRNKPRLTATYPKVLPGSVATLEQQCSLLFPRSKPCFTDETVCHSLYCNKPGTGRCVSIQPAAEGSMCGHGGICLNGKCVEPPQEFGKI